MSEASREWEHALDRPGSAGPSTIRDAVIFAAVIIVLTAAVSVWGGVQLPRQPLFMVFHAGFIFMVNSVTAYLLFGQFVFRRLLCYCFLSAAFLFGALIMIPFLLAFPGALMTDKSVIGGAQSSIWIWHFWHALFPALIALSLIARMHDEDHPVPAHLVVPFIVASVALALLLAALVTVAVTVFHDRLPVLTEADRPVAPTFYWATAGVTAVTGVAFALALRLARQRAVLFSWISMVLLALLADEADSSGTHTRYTVAWYFSRVEWMLAVSVLLVMFLTDINRLYRRLASAMHELFHANRKLSAAVRAKDAVVGELRRSAEQLRRMDERKDAFIAMLAHELRNPLAPLRNVTHLLGRGSDSQKVEWVAGVIDRQVGAMARLLEDLLDSSRVKRNRLELRRACVPLQDILVAACEQSQPLLERAQQRLVLDVPAEPICLDADKARLVQVFANLLNNAARYTPRAGTVTVTAARAGAEVVVRVRDAGIGIEPDKVGVIFDLFSQLEPRDRRAAGGLGIGLHLVKGLVELHGGSVTVQSDGAGKGSEFAVRLPALVERNATAAHPVSRRESARAGRPLHMLVVDDNRDSADSVHALLEMLGHQPRITYDARGALALGASFHPEIVLLDIGLPDMTGYECAARIRKTDWGREAFLIAMTGWGKAEDERRALEAGFDQHLVKPVDLDRLEQILAGCCRRPLS